MIALHIKKILLFLIISFFAPLQIFVHAEDDRGRQAFGTAQLKIVNLTDKPIYFYLSALHDNPVEIKGHEEYLTRKTIVSHRAPRRNNISCHFGIRYHNQRNIMVYSFRYRFSDIMFRQNSQYIVVVKKSGIGIIEGSIDGVYDYLDESLYQKFLESDWHAVKFNQHFIDLIIKNDSGSRRTVNIYTVRDELISLILQDGMFEVLRYDYMLLSLGGMSLSISEPNGYPNSISIEKLPARNHYDIPSTIEIRINSDGHEIIYDKYVNVLDIQKKAI